MFKFISMVLLVTSFSAFGSSYKNACVIDFKHPTFGTMIRYDLSSVKECVQKAIADSEFPEDGIVNFSFHVSNENGDGHVLSGKITDGKAPKTLTYSEEVDKSILK